MATKRKEKPTGLKKVEVPKAPSMEKPGETPETVTGPEISADVYWLMEKRDEAQIIADLEGRYIEEFVYEFCRQHKPSPDGSLSCNCKTAFPKNIVTGLSWTGIQEASRAYGGIKVVDTDIKETDDYIQITVTALDTKTNSSRLAIKRQPKMMKSGPGYIADKFCIEKAVGKAQRNAIKPLLPQTLLKQWIEWYRAGGKRSKLPAPKTGQQVEGPEKSTPPPEPEEGGPYKVRLERAVRFKNLLGDKTYYAVLLGYKAKHANEIKDLKIFDQFLLTCEKVYDGKKKEK